MAKADVLKDAGNRYFKNEDFSRAIKCYKEGLALDPGNPTINCNLAQAYLAVKEFADAEVHAVVTLAHQADSVKGFYRATRAALGMAKRERALSYLRTGLLNCPKAEELKTLYEEVNKENGDAASSSVTDSKVEKGDGKKTKDAVESPTDDLKVTQNTLESERPSRTDQTKSRSRSSSSRKRSSSKTSSSTVNARSISVNRTTSENLQLRKDGELNKENGPKRDNEPKKDEFLDTLLKVQSELSPDEKSPQQKEREALMEKQKKLQACMKEGSEALEIGLAKQASERYKCALDLMAECNIEVFGLREVNRIVLKYSLSICWIETLKYNNIIQSIGYLTEIETSCSVEFPAVYFGLGRAFYRLNRFKVALDHFDKGIKIVGNCRDIIPYPWPGTMKTIAETTKVGLKESISKLRYECKTYREPDAVCRYEKCLTVSTHICPSEIIFYSDPDFIGYVVIICQENCKITYHVGCWKHYKENLSSVGKLTDKDVLGHCCLTSDCVNERNEVSVIVRIEVYGEDGKIKASCSKEPTKTDNINEHRKEKKKKNEKIDKPVKVRTTRTRVRKLTPNTQNSVKKIKRKSTVSSEEFAACLQKLNDLRVTRFGLNDAIDWNPRHDYFGRRDISIMKTYLTHNNNDSDTLRERKDFLFTYFYEYLNDEGPQKISMIEQKWHEEVSQFPGINEFMSQHDGICDFLLQSYRFACIDDYLCLADQLTDTYQRVQAEVGESLGFILTHPSCSVENEADTDNCPVDKSASKSVENTSPNSNTSTPDLQINHDSIAASSSEGCSEIQWHKRDSECDSYALQETSECSSEEDSDYDDIVISTDSENEICYDGTNNTTVIDNRATIGDVQNNTCLETSVTEKSNDIVCHIPVAHCSSDTKSAFQELHDVNKSNFQSDIPEVPIPHVEEQSSQVVVLKNDAFTQTDSYCDLKNKSEALTATNLRLVKEVDEKQKLISNYQKEINDYYKQKIQMYENKLSHLTVEKEKTENDLRLQIGIRESKLDVTMKKHQEQLDKLSKKKEEDANILKKNIENMTELNKEVDKQSNTVTRLEGQLRKSNEQVLNIRKQFGEFKLDSYLEKCQERIQCMNDMVHILQDASTPSADEVVIAIEAWERVARELQDTRKLLQVQYEILSQQLKNKVSYDCLLQLELADLPTEPPYPLHDMDNILRIAMEYVQRDKSSSANGVHVSERDSPKPQVRHVENQAAAYPPPLLGISPFQPPGEYFGRLATNPFRLRSPFYPNNYSAYSRPNLPTQSGLRFGSPSPNENVTSVPPGTWTSEFQVGVLKNDKPNLIVSGEKSGANSPNMDEGMWMGGTSFKKLSKSVDSLLNGGTDVQKGANEVYNLKDGSSLSNVKQKDAFGDKKANNSTASGLTPIEKTKSGISEVQGLTLSSLKSLYSEVKQGGRSQRRWNYPKLFDELQKTFKLVPEVELSECLLMVREKNGNKLSGLSVNTIIRRVEKVMEERSSKKTGNMGMDKFGGTAWGEVKDNDVNWQNDDLEHECIICHVNIEQHNKTSLNCKHTFHTECIRKWLHTNSTCPICRKYTRLVDEFPPLA